MGNEHTKMHGLNEKKPSAEQDIDYAPKQHSLREQIVFCMKLIAIGGGVLLLLWLIE